MDGDRRPGGLLRSLPPASGVWRGKLEALFGVDVRSLALFRCAVGIILLVDLVERSRWLRENYTDLGILPRSLLAARPAAFPPSQPCSACPCSYICCRVRSADEQREFCPRNAWPELKHR